MNKQKTKREPKKSQPRASPYFFQLKPLFLQSKIHTTNSVGEIARVEIFNNGSLEKQHVGLLINALTKNTYKYVYLTLINGGIGVNKIRIPLKEFGDETKTNITRMRALIEQGVVQQFIPADKNENFTLNPESIRKLIKIPTEKLEEILLGKQES